MGLQYTAANCKIIIAFLMLGLFWQVSHAAAFSALYTVNVENVDVSAQNSVTAQEQAFQQAQQKAFAILSERLTMSGAQKTASLDVISAMVRDFEVQNEKISATRYVADYTIRFQPDAVSSFFGSDVVASTSYNPNAGKPLLILPILKTGGENLLWGRDNAWMQIWAKADIRHGAVKAELPLGDIADLNDVRDNSVFNTSPASMERIVNRYNASEAVLVVAIPDASLSELAMSDAAQGTLTISLHRADRGRAEYVQDMIVAANAGESVSDLYGRAVQFTYQKLQSSWKVKKTVPVAVETFMLSVSFQTLGEWMSIQQGLRKVAGIESFQTLYMQPKRAALYVSYRGEEKQFADALSFRGLELRASDNPETGQREYRVIKAHGRSSLPQTAPAAGRNAAVVHTF